jgi:hypothetical protein
MNKTTVKFLGMTLVLALSSIPAVAATPAGAFYSLAATATSLAPTAQATVEGTWSTRTRTDEDDGEQQIRLNMELDDDTGTWGWRVDPTDLDGLSFSQFDSDVDDARFELVRDAGTVSFEGRIRDGRGDGTFSFTPNGQWVSRMDDMGYDFSARRVFQAAIHDITVDYVNDLRGLGYDDLDTEELFSFAIHGVSIEFIEQMDGLGYADIPAQKIVQLRIHGVSPEWVRQIRDAMGG